MYTGGRTAEEEKAFDKYHQCWEPINTQPTDGDPSPERSVQAKVTEPEGLRLSTTPGLSWGNAWGRTRICGSSW